MPAESMVHALQLIWQRLKPGGLLIDIHPSGEPPPIDVRLGDMCHRVGWVAEEDDYIEYIQSDEALAEAVTRGWYTVRQAEQFAFTTYADNTCDLLTHLKTTWEDAIITERVIQQADDLLNSVEPEREIILREWIKILCLQKQDPPL